MCLFTKKNWAFGVLIIEIISLVFNLIDNLNDLKVDIVIFISGIIFVIFPKTMYVFKNKKKKKKM